MLDLILSALKKMGIPARIITIVAVIGTIVPALWALDDRYAKQNDLNVQVATLSKEVNDLSEEVGKLAGIQQVLVAVISSKSDSLPVAAAPAPAPVVEPPHVELPAASAPVIISTEPPKTRTEARERLSQVTQELSKTQQRVQAITQQLKQ